MKEARKLVKQSTGSLTIVLPVTWLRHNQLRKGDIVLCEFDVGSTLTVKPIP